MKISWKLTLFLAAVAWSNGVSAVTQTLPEENTIQGIAARFGEDFLRQFSHRIIDMQKTYQLSMTDNIAQFTDPSSTNRCSAQISAGDSLLTISRSKAKKENEISDSIMYSPCGRQGLFREVFIRRGAKLQDLSMQQIIDGERPFKLDQDQEAFSYRLIDSSGQNLVTYMGITRKDSSYYISMKYLDQIVLEIEGAKDPVTGYKIIRIIRSPMAINYPIAGRTIRSNFGGSSYLVARETKLGLLYQIGQSESTVSQSKWSEEFNAAIAMTASDYGATLFFEQYLTYFPKLLTAVQSIVSNKLIAELTDSLFQIRSGNIDRKKLEEVLTLQLEAAKKGLIKDERPQ